MKYLSLFLILSSCALISPQAFAHVEHIHNSQIASSFINGFAHPFSGADHIITLLLAGVFFARFATGKIKISLSVLTLLMASYLWLHSTEMSAMNNEFILGFLASSFTIISSAFLTDKFIISKIIKRYA